MSSFDSLSLASLVLCGVVDCDSAQLGSTCSFRLLRSNGGNVTYYVISESPEYGPSIELEFQFILSFLKLDIRKARRDNCD